MNLQNEKDVFKKQIYHPSQEEINNASYGLALFSANIKRFLPCIPSSKYIEMFQEVLYYQKISGAEQYDRTYLKETKILNHSGINLDEFPIIKPTVFATFHLGSYRLLNSFLYENGYKIVVIIDETVFLGQQENLLKSVKSVLKGKDTSDLIILNVNDRTSIFKLKELLNKGYVMTVYLDGNTGINAKSQNFSKGYISINFLNNKIFVKNGIGKLSALVDAQIIPVVSYRDEEERNNIEFFKEINIADFENKQEFSVKSIEIAYSKLEEKLIKYPAQWECWLYIQKWFERGFNSPYFKFQRINNEFNKERYNTFTVKQSSFLFDMYDYQSYPIEKQLFTSLNGNTFQNIGTPLLQELINKNILI
jgi:hypothetical protein